MPCWGNGVTDCPITCGDGQRHGTERGQDRWSLQAVWRMAIGRGQGRGGCRARMAGTWCCCATAAAHGRGKLYAMAWDSGCTTVQPPCTNAARRVACSFWLDAADYLVLKLKPCVARSTKFPWCAKCGMEDVIKQVPDAYAGRHALVGTSWCTTSRRWVQELADEGKGGR